MTQSKIKKINLDTLGLHAVNCSLSEWIGKQLFLETYYGEDLPAARLFTNAYIKGQMLPSDDIKEARFFTPGICQLS